MFRRPSILYKILIPLLIVMIGQSLLICGALFFGGTVGQLRQNSYDMFREKVSGRAYNVENEMIQRWSNIDGTVATVLQHSQDFLTNQEFTASQLVVGNQQTNQLLSLISDDLLYLIRKNSVTGAFVVLNGDGGEQKTGVYFRDPDPKNSPADYSDLLAFRCPSDISQELGIAMDSPWQPWFSVDRQDPTSDYYYKPFEAALQNPGLSYRDLGYWSLPFSFAPQLDSDQLQVVTYSVPLLDANGQPFGVLGVELSVDYFMKQLNSEELNDGWKDGYLVAVTAPDQETGKDTLRVTPAVQEGAFLNQLLVKEQIFRLQPSSEPQGFYKVKQDAPVVGEQVIGYLSPLQLYNTHTPFVDNQWAVIGLVSQPALLSFVSHFETLIVLCALLALFLGALSIMVVARRITQPVGNLAVQLQKADPNQPIRLRKVGIEEVDELSDAIEHLSTQVADSAQKLSVILEAAGVSVGAFEYNFSQPGLTFCTSSLFPIVGLEQVELQDNYLDSKKFKAYMYSLHPFLEETAEDETVFSYRLLRAGRPYWVRLKVLEQQQRILGVVTDVTQEMLEKKRLEYERDYDILTNLYNRRAFHCRMNKLFGSPEKLQTAAMLMLDLDNLKFINDTYGHDYGDEYIRSFAEVLKKFDGHNAVLSRLSGDEFILFLYGFETKDAIRAICDAIRATMWQTNLYLPDRSSIHIRASGGISWYPDDAENYQELIRYADFAMYMVKRTNKGQFTEFNIETYNKEAYLLHCREELNKVLENSLVDYQFQPIVDAQTGEIFAFEALMRPSSENIKTPAELISLARSQSKAFAIERLTFFRGLECFTEQEIANSQCKLFINSLPDYMMSDADCREFEKLYQSYLPRLVVEFTEEVRSGPQMVEHKLSQMKKWQMGLALDDFGVGFNGEAVLVDLAPDYIKVDMSIVRNIDLDNNRRDVLQHLINYCRDRGIKVIAEGVETRAEAKTLIATGVDYLQGYYFGRPTYLPSTESHFCRLEVSAIRQELAQENAAMTNDKKTTHNE